MHGNVAQWCQDQFGKYPQEPVVDPQGAEKRGSRVLRGGSCLPKQQWLLRALAEMGYWILPKPVDLGIILHKALDAAEAFGSIPELQKVQEIGASWLVLSVLSCVGCALGMVVVSTRQLADTDY